MLVNKTTTHLSELSVYEDKFHMREKKQTASVTAKLNLVKISKALISWHDVSNEQLNIIRLINIYIFNYSFNLIFYVEKLKMQHLNRLKPNSYQTNIN